MRVVDLIQNKRMGLAHTDEELQFLVQNYAQGVIPDYQMSAWLMAVVWQGMSDAETFALTGAMVASGEVLDLSGLPGVPVDKHSTGGVGDKATLAVVPILASAVVPVAKMSGRGLGHTGGTLDKLEAISGTRTAMTIPQILEQVERIGACICAQTDRLVPADQKMYALRDATATVESLPLIAASIMSKKIACGSHVIVLDVKVGSGAFMKTLENARALASLMIRIGTAYDRRVVAALTDMDIPLGYAIGNRVEVNEVAALLQNHQNAEPRLKQLVCTLSALCFLLSGRVSSISEGEALANAQIINGTAFAKLCDIINAQGGDTKLLLHPEMGPTAQVKWKIYAPSFGFVQHIDAAIIGQAAMLLGAGRIAKEDIIDPTAGIILSCTVGDRIASGSVLATLYTNSEFKAHETAQLVNSAFVLAGHAPTLRPIIYETLGIDTAH